MKNRYKLIALFAVGFLTQAGIAAERASSSQFQTDENGFAKAPAEFSGFTISATTHCDATATQANQTIRALAGQIEGILTRFADPTVEEGIQAFPGSITQGDLVKYQNGQQVTICKGWNASHSFFFKLTKLSDIPVFQDTILELNPAADPKRVISLTAPKPGIFSKTYEALVDQALKDAHRKAMRRAKVLMEDMPQFSEVALTRVTSSKQPSGSISYDQTGLGGDPNLSALSSVFVSVTRSFQFQLK